MKKVYFLLTLCVLSLVFALGFIVGTKDHDKLVNEVEHYQLMAGAYSEVIDHCDVICKTFNNGNYSPSGCDTIKYHIAVIDSIEYSWY